MRNTEHEFISMDTAALTAEMISMYEQLTGATVRPASPEALFIDWVASVVQHERMLNNYTANQNLPSRAEGQNLDALAELFYARQRPAAQPAACTVRFTISAAQEEAVLIPAGTRVTDTGKTLFWATEADSYISPGETTAELTVRCQTPGVTGNGWQPGQINAIVDVFDYYKECANITASDGGYDQPDDDTFYEQLRLSMDAFATAGAKGAYVYFAKQVSNEISDVVANSPTPGVVNIYVLMNGGKIAGEEIKKAVLAACSADDVRPFTDKVEVKDPEEVEYNVKLTYYVPAETTTNSAEIAAAVKNAADEYAAWQCAKLGRDINPSKLIGLLMQTGIKRLEVTEPVYQELAAGTEAEAPQVAKLGTVELTNGGYEDE